MNHQRARQDVQAWFEGGLADERRKALREHLAGCAECRAGFDETVRALRAMHGRPDELCEEELWLFAPELPQAPRAWWRWPAVGLGLAVAAALVMLVLVPRQQPLDDGFARRGGVRGAEQPLLRALCTRDEAGRPVIVEPGPGACREGDRVVFSVRARGKAAVAVVVAAEGREEVVLEGAAGALAPTTGDVELSVAASWRPGARAVAVFGEAPVLGEAASACAKGSCAAGLVPVTVELDPR